MDTDDRNDGGEEGEKTPCELSEVSFSVNFAQKGPLKLMVLKETSTFRKTDEGVWLYAKGDVTYEASPVVEGEAASIVEGSEKAAPDAAGVVA